MKNKIKQKIKKALPFLLVVLLSAGMILSCYFVTKHFEGENTLMAGADEVTAETAETGASTSETVEVVEKYANAYNSVNLFTVGTYSSEHCDACVVSIDGLNLTVGGSGPLYYLDDPTHEFSTLKSNIDSSDPPNELLTLDLESNTRYSFRFELSDIVGVRKVRLQLFSYNASGSHSWKTLFYALEREHFEGRLYNGFFTTGEYEKYGLVFSYYLDMDATGCDEVSVTFTNIQVNAGGNAEYVPSFTDYCNLYAAILYSEFYDKGYIAGYDVGKTKGYDKGYIDGEQFGYNNGEQFGYNIGYDEGYNAITQETIDKLESEVLTDGETFLDFIFAIFDAPLNVIRTALDFEILGFNVSDLIFFILTLFLFVMVLKKIKGG